MSDVIDNLREFGARAASSSPSSSPSPRYRDPGAKAPISIEWLPLSVMFRDPVVNPRDPEDRVPHLRKIAERFDWNSLRPFVLSKRGPGSYALVNGAGTHLMIQRFKPEFAHFLFPCIVINVGEGKVSTEQRTDAEAISFGNQGLDAKLQPSQFFHTAAARGVDWVVDLQAELASHGFVTAQKGKWPSVVPLPVALTLYKYTEFNPRLLLRTLDLARSVWSGHAVKASHLVGLALVLSSYPDNLDEKRLRHIMRGINPLALVADLQKSGGAYTHVYAVAFGIAEKLITAYDYEFRGQLIGGTRKANRYYPERAALTATFDGLLPVWKNAASLAKRAAISKEG